MLRSENNDDPANFEGQLFSNTPMPRYKYVSCASVTLPKIYLLDSDCIYLMFVNLLNSESGEIVKNNNVVYVPSEVTLEHDNQELLTFFKKPMDAYLLRFIIEKTKVVLTVEHLELFLHVVSFVKELNVNVFNTSVAALWAVVRGEAQFVLDEITANVNNIVHVIFSTENWYSHYEHYSYFVLNDYVKITYETSTEKFYYEVIKNVNRIVEFCVLPFQTSPNTTHVKYNELQLWLGNTDSSWRVSYTKPYDMPLICRIRKRFGFLKVYLDIVWSKACISADENSKHLAVIIPTNYKSGYFRLKENYVPVAPFVPLLTCSCIIKTAFNEMVHFDKKDNGTTVVLEFK